MMPPKLARLLVRIAVGREDAPCVLEDLARGFQRVHDASGPTAARRWYWWQALRGLGSAVPRPGAVVRGARDATVFDVRMVARALLRRPVYALGSVGALALGLTSAASVFAVAWNVWLRPLPIPEPHQVVRLFELDRVPEDGLGQRERQWLSPPLLEDLRHHEWSTFQAVAGLSPDNHDWSTDEATVQLAGLRTTPELATVLGLRPLHGRFLSEEPGAAEVVLTEPFWRRAFGADPGVVDGATLQLEGAPHRVVGVVRLPDGYPGDSDVITALTFDEESLTEGWRGARYLQGVARVRPRRSAADAQREFDAFVAGLGGTYAQHRGRGGLAVELGADLASPYRDVLALLLLAGAAFLGLAVVNVAGLVVIRRAQEGHERGVRAALGASRGRILGADLAEAVLMGTAAGVVGVVVTYWILTPIVALVPPGAPRLDQVGMTGWLAAAVVACGVVVGAVVGGIGHALSRPVPAVGRSHAGGSGLWGRRLLVVGQVALTTVLATGGVTVLRYVDELRAVDMGFEPEGVLGRMAILSQSTFASSEALIPAWVEVAAGLRARGMEVAVGTNPPVTNSSMRYGYRVPSRPDEEQYAQYHAVTGDYFRILGIDLLDGRTVADSDVAGGEPVVVVSEAVARRHYPDGRAVGETLRLVGTDRRIVGVVASTRHFGPDSEAPDEVYVPLQQDRSPYFGWILMRTPLDDAGAVVDDVLRRVDPSAQPMPTLPFTRHVAAWFAPLTLQLYVVSALGVVGMLMASLGLYALVAYQVSLRRREMGIRKALGAPVVGLFRSVVGQGVSLATVGLLVGLGAWYLLVPFLSELITGLDVGDLVVPVVVAALVTVVAGLATVIPAWRSSAVDPSIALQAE